jgi:hypothetical protein
MRRFRSMIEGPADVFSAGHTDFAFYPSGRAQAWRVLTQSFDTARGD